MDFSNVSSWILGAIVLICANLLFKRQIKYARLNYPVASTNIPIFGSAIAFGVRGLEFLKESRKKYGNVFVVDLLILRFHFVLGPKCIQAFYKAPNNVCYFHYKLLWLSHLQVLDFLGAVPDVMPELVEDAWEKNPEFQSKGHVYVQKAFNQKEKLELAYRLVIEESDKAFFKWSKMEKIDIFDEASRLTIKITLRFILGDDLCNEKGEMMADLYDQLEKDLASPLVMTLRPLPTKPYRRLIKNRNALLEIMKESVIKRVQDQDRLKKDGSFLQYLIDELGPEYVIY